MLEAVLHSPLLLQTLSRLSDVLRGLSPVKSTGGLPGFWSLLRALEIQQTFWQWHVLMCQFGEVGLPVQSL